MAQWLDPKAPMLARSLQKAGYATGHFGKWHMGGQRNVADAPAITEYGFDQSLTNFEGMGPKLLPLTLKPGQDPDKPGRIWADAVRPGKGVRWMQRSKITEGFVEEAIPFIKKAQSEEKPFISTFGRTTCTVRFGLPLQNGETVRNAGFIFPCWRPWTSNLESYSTSSGTTRDSLTIRSFSPAPTTELKKAPGYPVRSEVQDALVRGWDSILACCLGPGFIPSDKKEVQEK